MGLWFGFVSELFLILSQLSFLCCCSQDDVTGDENSNTRKIGDVLPDTRNSGSVLQLRSLEIR